LRLLALLDVVRFEFINLVLLLEVEDGDGGGGGSAEPVSVRREDKSVDLVASLQRVKVFRLVQVPQHGGTVLATGSAQRSIGRDGDGVDVASVTDVVGLDAARSQFPDLR
jgi:hypothetical protein